MEGEPAQVRMADRHEAEEVVDLALESARRERPRREGGEPRVVGRQRQDGITGIEMLAGADAHVADHHQPFGNHLFQRRK